MAFVTPEEAAIASVRAADNPAAANSSSAASKICCFVASGSRLTAERLGVDRLEGAIAVLLTEQLVNLTD